MTKTVTKTKMRMENIKMKTTLESIFEDYYNRKHKISL